MTKYVSPCLLVLFASCLVLPGQAVAELRVAVRNESGLAVADAVVTLSALDATTASGSVAAAPTATMAQRGHRFVPFVLPVARDTRVRFPNFDDTRHHVYSFSPAKTFEIKLYRGDPETLIEFDDSGVVAIGCNIHDYMQAFIYVTEAQYFVTSDEAGIARFEAPAPGRYRMETWHPWQRQQSGAEEVILTAAADQVLDVMVRLDPPPPRRPEENALMRWLQDPAP